MGIIKSESHLRYIDVDVIITETPHPEASIHRNHIIQHEVCTTGIVLFDNDKSGVHYNIRFVHDRTIETASKLRSGDKIHVDMGRFDKRRGRNETDFIVKKYTLLKN